jgi:hypothetical protein
MEMVHGYNYSYKLMVLAPVLQVTTEDTLEVLLAPEVRVSIGSPAPFYIGPTTEIEVCLSTSGHQRNLDMGIITCGS